MLWRFCEWKPLEWMNNECKLHTFWIRYIVRKTFQSEFSTRMLTTSDSGPEQSFYGFHSRLDDDQQEFPTIHSPQATEKSKIEFLTHFSFIFSLGTSRAWTLWADVNSIWLRVVLSRARARVFIVFIIKLMTDIIGCCMRNFFWLFSVCDAFLGFSWQAPTEI